jgi:2-keto-4-pentenoate hydratase/2-oxohepta-3-ene-1,7-dioic acid hydratase in catechol pathway
MRLATITQAGAEIAALVLPDGVLPIPALNAGYGTAWSTTLSGLLDTGELAALENWLSTRDGELTDRLSESLLDPATVGYGPLYRHPSKIWGIGLNYVEHAADLSERAPSTEPASFMKPDTTIIGPGEKIVLPPQSERVTAEAELGVVIGRITRDVEEDEALAHVAGFTTVIDMTAEDILQRNPRYLTRSKSFDTFFSFGPQLITTAEVLDGRTGLGELSVGTWINGALHRENVVGNMTFSPEFLVSFHSKVMTLLPGDIISTGTPGAVVISDGDVAGCRIDGFPELSNPVVRS